MSIYNDFQISGRRGEYEKTTPIRESDGKANETNNISINRQHKLKIKINSTKWNKASPEERLVIFKRLAELIDCIVVFEKEEDGVEYWIIEDKKDEK